MPRNVCVFVCVCAQARTACSVGRTGPPINGLSMWLLRLIANNPGHRNHFLWSCVIIKRLRFAMVTASNVGVDLSPTQRPPPPALPSRRGWQFIGSFAIGKQIT